MQKGNTSNSEEIINKVLYSQAWHDDMQGIIWSYDKSDWEFFAAHHAFSHVQKAYMDYYGIDYINPDDLDALGCMASTVCELTKYKFDFDYGDVGPIEEDIF